MGEEQHSQRIKPLLEKPATVLKAPGPKSFSFGSPSIEVLSAGRVVVSVDQSGPGAKTLIGKKYKDPLSRQWSQTVVLTSGDQGSTWTPHNSVPMSRGCLVRDGHVLYLMGDTGALQIARSDDGGHTWSRLSELKASGNLRAGQFQAPAGALCASGELHLASMISLEGTARREAGAALSVVMLHAPCGENLTRSNSWAFSEASPTFRDLVPQEQLDFLGLPFFDVPNANRAEAVAPGRWAQRLGWGHAHLVKIHDPRHAWHDPSGKTIHLLAPLPGHRSNIAALAKVVRDDEGGITFSLERTPAGKTWAFLPLPGGHLDFDILFDEPSGLYWLASNQVRDSMLRPDQLPKRRYGLPADETRRLQLHFSSNLVDWCYAGMLDAAEGPGETRSHCRMAVRGKDLHMVYCASDAEAGSPRFPNLVQYGVVPDFRGLVY